MGGEDEKKLNTIRSRQGSTADGKEPIFEVRTCVSHWSAMWLYVKSKVIFSQKKFPPTFSTNFFPSSFRIKILKLHENERIFLAISVLLVSFEIQCIIQVKKFGEISCLNSSFFYNVAVYAILYWISLTTS
jgi:hypothetical protein